MTVVAKLSGFLVVLAAVFGVAFLTGTQSAALLAPPSVHDNTLGGLRPSVDGYTLTAVEPDADPGADQFRRARPDRTGRRTGRRAGPDGRHARPPRCTSSPSAAT